MIKKLLFIALFILIGRANAQDHSARVLVKRKEINDSLPTKGLHEYTIQLDSSNFVFGRVNQKTLDVAIEILNPQNEKVATFDRSARGPESFKFESKEAGKYTIQLSPFKDGSGLYSINMETVAPVATEPAERVQQLLAEYEGKDIPGVAAMVMRNGNILFSEAYGMANLSYNVPFTTKTPTNIGSTSKQFTALAVEMLAQQGKLSLDDNIRKYFPELPEFKHEVSIRNLLTHTSGYREFINTLSMTGRDMDAPLDRERIFAVIKNQPELQNEPGTAWNYNNTGFAILAALVEKVTGAPFPKWMKTNVFEPLGMENTMVRKDQYQVIEKRAAGYTLDEDGNYQEAQDLGGAMGAGGFYTTAEDLAKWMENFDKHKIGSEAIYEEMTTPFKLKNGVDSPYGFGLFIGKYKGLKSVNHGGDDIAHHAMLLYFPEIKAGVAVASNNATFNSGIAYRIADTFFAEEMQDSKNTKEENPESPDEEYDYNVENFDALTGRYEMLEMPGFILNFARDGERIYSQATGQGEVNLYALSDSIFKLKNVAAKIKFHLKEDGSADSLTLYQHGEHLAKKIEWQPTTEELKEFVGEYYSEEIGTVYKVKMEEEKLTLNQYNIKEPMPLDPADKDSFGSTYPISDLSFTRNKNGAITGFSASNMRTKGVYFEKMKED